MNSVDLKFFQAVVKANSIGGAAFALNTVQSNVSDQIRQLEHELGVPLLVRGRRGAEPTEFGTVLLEEAKKVVTDKETPKGALRIGSMETTAAQRLSPILIRYACDYPEVDVQIETGPTEALVGEVLNRRLDGAFVSGPVEHEELESVPIVAEELVLISSPKIASMRELEQAASSPSLKVLAFRAGCSYRRRMDAYLAGLGAVDVRWMELGTLDGIIGCVSAGVGLAMLPRSVVQDAVAAGRVVAHCLPESRRSATTVFVRRRHEYAPASLQCFINLAVQTFCEGQAAA
jgi:DNA-binding transcriptional LysR family regulator